MKMKKCHVSLMLVSVFVLSTITLATMDAAGFVTPDQWSMGDAGSTYQEWDIMTGAAGNTPDVGVFSPGAPTLEVLSPGYRSAATSNFYSYSGDYGTEAAIANYGGVGGTQIIVQVSATMFGSDSVYADSLEIVDLSGNAITGGANADALAYAVLFVGEIWVDATQSYATQQEQYWEFFLPGYTGDFRAKSESIVHSSFQQLRVDSMIADSAFAVTVPEPATMAILGFGGLLLRRRK
jgi:hypothetical protein